ncbi:PTS sugar transporter subunit IIA [Enterococcus sp. LJL51]|uniref:PTS sugar transporter subunit IIA n=1 Tax=Enterococcus sp. LJL51 TaxID=3416656 RepID=UPI003CFB48C5
MNANPLYQVFLNQASISKEQVYQFIADTAVPFLGIEEKKQIVHSLVEREKVGNTQIAEQVVLPHLESSLLGKSEVYLIRLKEEITEWTKDIRNIKLIIAILLKKDETIEEKKKISEFTKKLADEQFLEKLLIMETETDFYKEIQEF